MSQRTGGARRRVGVAAEPLRLLRPRFVDAPPDQREQVMTALRALFRDELEERLASRRESSVHPSSMPGDAAE
jgi:hypothetical protein